MVADFSGEGCEDAAVLEIKLGVFEALFCGVNARYRR